MPSRSLLPLVKLAFSSGRGSLLSALGSLREGGEQKCLPLAQGERRGYRRKLLLHLLWAEAAAPSPPLLSHGQLLRGNLEPPRSHSPHRRSREMAGLGSLPAGAPRAGVPGPRSGHRAGRGAEQKPPPAAKGHCAPRRAPCSCAGSLLSELQFQCVPGLQHPLRPPPETTFNSPAGSRCPPRRTA